MTGLLEPLGSWVSGLRWGDIPERARRAARLQILDLIASIHSTARAPELAAVLSKLPFGSGPSTVIATGAKHAPAEAAFLNAAYSMAQDYDSIIWMGHTSHSAVTAALAVGEALGASAEAVLTAVVAGNEIAGRLGASSFLGPLNGQMWTFIHLVGAAAATASLLDLDPQRATHALAIALAQPTYALQPAFLGPTSKLLAASVPTQIGIQSAYFAAVGMVGATDVLEDRRGFWRVFTFAPMPKMLEDLGELWAIETLQLKSAPCCHYFQTACEAVGQIFSGKPAPRAAIARIEIATTKLGDEVTRFAREYAKASPDLSAVGASFDMAIAVAIVLEAGRMSGEESREQWLTAHAASLKSWYGIISIEHDPHLTMRVVDGARAFPSARAALRSLKATEWLSLVKRYRAHYGSSLLRGKEVLSWTKLARRKRPTAASGLPLYFPNRVSVHFTNGETKTVQIDLPLGAMDANIDAVLATKWHREVTPRLGEQLAQRGLELGLRFEHTTLPELMAAVSAR